MHRTSVRLLQVNGLGYCKLRSFLNSYHKQHVVQRMECYAVFTVTCCVCQSGILLQQVLYPLFVRQPQHYKFLQSCSLQIKPSGSMSISTFCFLERALGLFFP